MTHNEAVAVVEKALDRYCAQMARRGFVAQGVTAKTLAAAANVSPPTMWSYLQTYRTCQRRIGATRYVIACKGYSRRARWSILSRPGSDPADVRTARRAHAVWVAKDAAQRVVRDGLTEVRPGLHGGRWDEAIAAVQQHTEQVFIAQAELASRLLDGEEP